MYKTTYELDVIFGATELLLTDDDPTPGAASTALAQIKACRDIDSLMIDSDAAQNVIIPYHAIDFVAVTPTRTEVEDPTDDTCITDDDEEGD